MVCGNVEEIRRSVASKRNTKNTKVLFSFTLDFLKLIIEKQLLKKLSNKLMYCFV